MIPARQAETDDEALFQQILAGVQKPLRYIGGEWNSVVKDHSTVDVTMALAFPDTYEIGMSHLGFRILYAFLNARTDTAVERVFCPWPDMADSLRRHRRPLSTLETGTPLAHLDLVGFSLQYEMTFTNVLEMLDLAGIPLRSAQRGDEHPLVLAGGPVVFNVEPLADFVDLVLIGDGEELIPEFLDRLKELKAAGATRAEKIRALARVEGVYAPSLYNTEPDSGHGLQIPIPTGDAPYPVRRRIVFDLDAFPYPDRIVVPHGEIVHDRVSVEIMRGCPVGCRFCQAGYIYRPTRERDPNQVRDTVIRSIRATGYDEFALGSLNTGEYGAIQPLLFDLMDRFEPERVSVSLASMHASTMTPELARQVRRVRKSGFTSAPEAGTQRLRDVINKNLSEEQILTATRLAFEAGWDLIKLYFMIGLPTETDADIDGLVDLAHEILADGRRVAKGRRPEITLSASSFIPKPVTPFQWLGMDRAENLHRKQDRIAARVRRGVRFKHHETETSFLEGVFSRGDRSLGNVLERAWRNGARFDGWGELFRLDAWQDAFRSEGIDPEPIAHNDWSPSGRLPWDVIDSRINKRWLALELNRALTAGTLAICGPKECHGCAPFARECVKGIVAVTTGRPLDTQLPVLSTPAAPGPGIPACGGAAPPLLPKLDTEKGPVAAPVDGPRHRYRARFRKAGRIRFLGHLDLARAVMRALRRAGVAFAYSQGFNPKPKVAFGPALSVGIGSEGEYFDFDTVRPFDPEEMLARINRTLPAGIVFDALRSIRPDAPALTAVVRAARYRVHTGDGPNRPNLEEALIRFKERGPVIVQREREGKVRAIPVAGELLDLSAAGGDAIRMTLAVGGSGGALRPDELLHEIFGAGAANMMTVREELLVEWNGRLVNPLLAAQAAAADAERASV